MKLAGLLSFFLLADMLFFIVSIPMLMTWSRAPSGTMYTWVHGTPIDYYQYLSVIKEGMHGAWQTTDLYTTEPTQKSLVFIFFLIIGKIGALFGLSPIAIYHLTRIGAIELMFLMIYRVCAEVVGKNHAFFAATIGLFSTVPPIMYSKPLQAYVGDTAWWDVLDSLHRVDYLPHHAFGVALLFTTIFFILRFMRTRRVYQFIIAFIAAFVAGIVYPTTGLFIFTAPPLVSILYVTLLFRKKGAWEIHRVFPIFLISAAALLSLLVMRGEIAKGFPWSGWQNGYGVWLQIGHFERNFLYAAIVPLFLGFPILVSSLLKGKDFSKIFVSVWVVTPIILVFLSALLGLERIRMAYMGQFSAYGILIVLSLLDTQEKLKTRWKQRTIVATIAMALMANSLLTTGYYFHSRLAHEIYQGENFHLPKKLLPVYAFIDTQVPRYSNVLGDYIVGNTLPAFATVKTYYGHWTQTQDYWRKEKEVQSIFTRQYSAAQTATLLFKEKIQYIVVRTNQERQAIESLQESINIKKIYSDGDIKVFKVEASL